MNIELLDEKRVLIDLCVEDMQLLSLEYKSLSMQSVNNRKIINNLVRIAKIKTGFCIEESATVFVEAMPYNGGCFILITLNSDKGKKYRVVRKRYKKMFLFDNCEAMLSAIEKIYPSYAKCCESTLAVKDNIYYLLISSKNKLNNHQEVILSEFSKARIKSSIHIAHILEHSKAIAENNAIEKIGSVLCKNNLQSTPPKY